MSTTITFHYTLTHTTTGKVFVKKAEFASEKEFLERLAQWNKMSDGFWKYNISKPKEKHREH